MYKSLGLSTEHVCELGKWKNFQAFSNHYMRLDSSTVAGGVLAKFLVHNISPGISAEPDQSCTPRTFTDLGGSDWDGVARKTGEPPLISPPSSPVSVFYFAAPALSHSTHSTSTRRRFRTNSPSSQSSEDNASPQFKFTATARQSPTEGEQERKE